MSRYALLRKTILVRLSVLSIIVACGKTDTEKTDTAATINDSETPDAAQVATGTLVLNIQPLSSAASFAVTNAEAAANSSAQAGSLMIGAALRDDTKAFNLSSSTWPTFTVESITSGPPDGLKLTFHGITLESSVAPSPETSTKDSQSKESGRSVLLDSEEGITVSVDSGNTNLGSLADNNSEFKVAVGTYDRIKLRVRRQAEVKGCVSGNFQSMQATGAQVNGEHTYCTRSGYSSFDSVLASNADFEDRTPEWMALDLAPWTTDGTGPDDIIELTFPIAPSLSMTKDTKLDLTLVMDLNRFLRYYNRNRIDQGAGPEARVDRTYFFYSLPIHAFVGSPGRIYGYQILALACRWESLDTITMSCASPYDEIRLGSWLTIITAPDGSLLQTAFMPDDDNALTVFKGGNQGFEGLTVKKSATEGLVDIDYYLNTKLGTMKNFPADLEATAVDEEISGVTFDAQQTTDASTHYGGSVFVKRRL